MKVLKFNIGDKVYFKDTFAFNSCEDVTTIGQITSIHVKEGSALMHKPKSEYKPEKLNAVYYMLTGCNMLLKEEVLTLYQLRV